MLFVGSPYRFVLGFDSLACVSVRGISSQPASLHQAYLLRACVPRPACPHDGGRERRWRTEG